MYSGIINFFKMYIEILKTMLKLIKKNFVFLILFFILNFLSFKYLFNGNSAYYTKILFNSLISLFNVTLVIILSISMKYNKINCKKAIIYLVIYSLLELLTIVEPLLIIQILLRPFLTFLPYLYFIENLNLKNSITLSIKLFVKLFIYIILLLSNYSFILILILSRLLINKIPVGGTTDIIKEEVYGLLHSPLFISLHLLCYILMITSIYFAFKIYTEKTNENEAK